MSAPFDMLSIAFIRKWLAGLVLRGGAMKARPGPTMDAIAVHTGIPLNTLKWLVHKDTAHISRARQRLLSRTIAEIENGQLVFELQGNRKVAVRVDRPRARIRYGFTFGPAGPKLRTIDRPAPFQAMPSFRNILLKP